MGLAGITQQQYDVLLQNVRKVYVRIDLLDFATERKIDELQAYAAEGAINVNGSSNYRRVANLSLAIENSSLSVGYEKKFWVNKKIRILTGLLDIISGEIVYFDHGVFIINAPTISYSAADNVISFEALDKMSLSDGTFSGSLEYITQILAGTNVSVAFKETAEKLSGVVKYNIEPTDNLVPYLIKKDAANTVYDLLKELSELYMDWEFFFDFDGTLVFRKIGNRLSSPVVWNFKETDDLVISCANKADFANVKNSVQVWGRILDNGTQIKYYIENNNANHPFSIPVIGKRAHTYSDDKIYTPEQAQLRAEYELNKKSNLNETLSIQCPPLYGLDVNCLFYIESRNKDIEGLYLIDSLTIPLVYSDAMTIQSHKIYDHVPL